MGRWTQYEEDASRLPEGFMRVGYDAETQRYKFKDRYGKLYQSELGAAYGTLTPIADPSTRAARERPGVFEDPTCIRPTTLSTSPTAIKTFQDFLPPESIATSPPSPSDSPPTKHASKDQFVSAVRRTALPKMHGVVTGLRRSITTARKQYAPIVEDQRGLLRSDSVASSATASRSTTHLDRAGSVRSDVSTTNRLSVDSPRK
ncbi:hypothetical protein BDQ17DRAFT_1345202 [Cyathus striatus]|nr:hypothetical protein BDQ17DRAFT_1345202 [Cyathus striatus]